LANFSCISLNNSNFVDLVQLNLENKLLEVEKKFLEKRVLKFKNSQTTGYIGVVVVKINEKFQNTKFRYFSITLSLFF